MSPTDQWTTRPLWSMFRRVKDVGHPGEEMLSVFRDHGVVAKSSMPNLNQTAENRDIYQLVHPGWLVINRMKAWQGSVGISGLRGIVSGHYVCFEPEHHDNPSYLDWLLRSSLFAQEFRRLSRGVRPGQQEIDNEQLRLVTVTVPPRSKQDEIARYVDRETARLDELIAEHQVLISASRERRQAVVLRSLDAATLQTNGQRLKHAVDGVRQGWSPQCESFPADGVTEWGVLKTGCVNRGVYRPTENKRLPEEIAPRTETAVRAGEIIVARASTRDLVGSAAVVTGKHPRLMLSDKLYSIRMDPQIAEPEFVALRLGTRPMRDLIELEASGASHSMQNISQSDILNLPMPLPSVEDQRRVLLDIQAQVSSIDSLIDNCQELVVLLKERRAALITAAVTGQIGVRSEID